MVLKVIASGSKGNSYALIGKDEILLIEAGASLMEVKKNIDFMVSKIAGCIVSHWHLDHSRYMEDYIKSGIGIYAPEPPDTGRLSTYRHFYPQRPAVPVQIGGFSITPFECVHDTECLGYLIRHDGIGKLLFATDTEYIRYRFKGLNHVMIEANYSHELVKDVPNRNHVLQGHMEISTACEFLRVNKNPDLMNVLLVHLSDRHSNAESFKEQAGKAAGCRVHTAEKGLIINMGAQDGDNEKLEHRQ